MAPQGPLPSAFNVADRDVADKEAAQMFYAVATNNFVVSRKRTCQQVVATNQRYVE
ncbi:unnamed protein product [Ilex paraguariensis]|uniref:Uncharacterized protein n=1 Tax=Ilex paraguariensis TaxID=185542 RepID=A0ABC8RSL3_9AQUA